MKNHLDPFINHLNELKSFNFRTRLFSKTISCMCWYPLSRELLLIASKNGDIKLVKINCDHGNTSRLRAREKRYLEEHSINFWQGNGRGSTITGLKVDLNDNSYFYCTSTRGKIFKRCLYKQDYIVLKDENDFDPIRDVLVYVDLDFAPRYSCFDVDHNRNLLIAGDNYGSLHFVSTSGLRGRKGPFNFCSKFHSAQVLHCEFNPVRPNIFVTSSVDGTFKLWDVRMISSKPVCIKSVKQEFAVNCATFSLTNGATLITNDNKDEIRVYRGPFCELEKVIKHNHRQYQETSLLKAIWHQDLDIVLISKSSSDDIQGIDVIDVHKGKIIAHLTDGQPGILAINTFNTTGDVIASSRGSNLIIWKRELT